MARQPKDLDWLNELMYKYVDGILIETIDEERQKGELLRIQKAIKAARENLSVVQDRYVEQKRYVTKLEKELDNELKNCAGGPERNKRAAKTNRRSARTGRRKCS